MPHDIKGAGIYCYVVMNDGAEATDELRKSLVAMVRQEIGPIASPDVIQFADGLPKTRSGKIMRRILRKLAENPAGPARPSSPPFAHSVPVHLYTPAASSSLAWPLVPFPAQLRAVPCRPCSPPLHPLSHLTQYLERC
jgi:hypothetical protein